MVASRSGDGDGAGDSGTVTVSRRRWSARRVAAAVGLSLLLLLLLALVGIWIARRPIASNILEREFERRGVEATYELERVGLRTQVVRNLVIGDPDDPDLVARFALIQLRPRWDGTIQVYRIVARGVRLEGRLVGGRVSWGQLDRLLPPPTDEPFEFPNIVVDLADASISLATPNGPVGFAVRGAGNLTGGFEGFVAARSPHLDFGRCRLSSMASFFAVEIVARKPQVEGPLSAARFACPASNLLLEQPRFVLDARLAEGLDDFEGSARVSASQITAGANGLAALTGLISFEGNPGDASGELELAARQSRLGPVVAERTRLEGRYRLDAEAGTLSMISDYAAEDATLARSMLAGVTDPLASLRDTPLGPVATAIGNAIRRTASSFDAEGHLIAVNAPAGGAARIESATVSTESGARITVGGGNGLTYYWPSGVVRIDTRITTQGGGLPTGEIVLRQPRRGAPLSGVASFRPYRVGETVLALQPIRFRATQGGATEFDTLVQLSGPFPDGRVRDLRLPVRGRFAAGGAFEVGRGCAVASFDFLRFRELQLGPTRLPLCPAGQPAMVMRRPGGGISIGVRTDNPDLRGRLGSAPLRLTADDASLIGGKDFTMTSATMRLGDPDAPIIVETDRLRGTFSGSGISGTLADAEVIIGNVPLLISEADAEWRFYQGDLIIEDELMLSDRAADPRFYPLRSDDFRFVLSGSDITAGGTLRHPATGTRVTDVSIEHDLDTGAGHAVLDVPGITFGAGLQPDELTRLSEGVIALVEGTVRGQGRINWDSEGEVTSTGTFSTTNMDLAAPFGPVEGLTTTVRFTDLLGMETGPGQVAMVRSINPGILVENGVITYQLLPNQLVRIERGVWPFMGGQLILHETVLNFGRPSAKRLTFEVVGLDAKVFVDSLGFDALEATGRFDGVLPMIFDESGGRIVGGRLQSRPPGGTLAYTGEIGDMGMFAELAFDALKNLRYRDMVIRLDGDLAGEFATRITIDQLALGETTTANILRTITKDLRFKFNITIRGPFRSIIQTIKSLDDPTRVIAPVLPFPIDAPGIVTETRRIEEQEQRTQTPTGEEVEVTPEPPAESER
jgi:translocation and assembly module TamB